MNKWTKIPHGYPRDGAHCFIAILDDFGFHYYPAEYTREGAKFICDFEGWCWDANEECIWWVEIPEPD